MERSESTSGPKVDSYIDRLQDAHLTPLWTFFKEWFPAEPEVDAAGYLWRYDSLRPLLMESATAITAMEAERRVLALENPGLPGKRTVTDSLYAGLQLLMPAEIAPPHRHTPAALRFIVEGRGAYTAVSGEKAYMEPGDFIVTPSWTWHEHGNEGSGPMVWLDVLDVPLVRFLGACFSEHDAREPLPRRGLRGHSRYRDGTDMVPAGRHHEPSASPISYPYAQAREALEHSKRHDAPDPCHGLRMQYIDPTTGGPAIPTISTFLQLLPRGFSTDPYASTSGAVYAVVEGAGHVSIGNGSRSKRFDFGPRDIWAVPSWQASTIHTDVESIIFSASDEAVQRKLGIWREQKGNPNDEPEPA
jgi:gentisate 1,2-dioxygenase